MDGTLVPITAPKEQKQRYVDKNHNYAINVMRVSDHKRLIRIIYIGQPGSVNDGQVFRRSPLAQCLYFRNDKLSEVEHNIGDSGYVCTEKMLTPYRNDGHLRESHRYYNYLLSQCRSTVERCNGLLKMRMQRLERLYWQSIDSTCMHLAASAFIHNFILLGGEEMDGMLLDEPQPGIYAFEAINAARQGGINKRNELRENLVDVLARYND